MSKNTQQTAPESPKLTPIKCGGCRVLKSPKLFEYRLDGITRLKTCSKCLVSGRRSQRKQSQMKKIEAQKLKFKIVIDPIYSDSDSEQYDPLSDSDSESD